MLTILNSILLIILIIQNIQVSNEKLKAHQLVIDAYKKANDIGNESIEQLDLTNKLIRRTKYTNKLKDVTFNYYN